MQDLTFDISGLDDLEKEAGDVLIITALRIERDFLSRHLERAGARQISATPSEMRLGLFRWRLPTPRKNVPYVDILTKCLDHSGNGIAALEALTLFLTHDRPRLVVSCGIGGSLKPHEAVLGSVVVSKSVRWHGIDAINGPDANGDLRHLIIRDYEVNSNLVSLFGAFGQILKTEMHDELTGHTNWLRGTDEGELIVHRINELTNNPAFEEDIRDYNPEFILDRNRPNLIPGRLFSWDFLINNQDTRRRIQAERWDYYVVDMESGGIAAALQRASECFPDKPVAFVAVRGISDHCHDKTIDIFRKVAADYAAAVTVSFLKYTYFPGF